MKTEITMPKMGESITEGTLIKWHKKRGDTIKKDEIIYEISTDKVDTEIPSPVDGVLLEIKVNEQETVEVGTIVAVIETNDEDLARTDIKEEAQKNGVNTHPSLQIDEEVIDIPMPKMGESVMEGTIIKWHKKEGDPIKRDEIIFEISTDKVDTEVPSPVDGIIVEILFNENETVTVDTIVAKIKTSSNTMLNNEKTIEKKVAIKENSRNDSIEISKQVEETIVRNKFFSPLVLNIAKKENIRLSELETIKGSGIGGRITKKDVLHYIKIREEDKQTISRKIDTFKAETSEIEFKPGERVQKIPMDNIRQKIMHHMVHSRDTSVHVTAVLEVDMSSIHNFIENKREEFFKKEGIKLTYMPFISFAVIKALKEFPLMNASIDEQNIILKKYINLGIAVAVEPNGLIVPNIKNADEKSIHGLAKAIADLGQRSRTKKLLPEDVADGTFSITNYGVFGSLFGTPIINQPEVGILGVGAVIKKPVVIDMNGVESIAIKPMMYLALSHDHRLVDGMLGGKFLLSIKNTLENFDISLI